MIHPPHALYRAELRHAVTEYMRGDNSYWPKPGRLRSLAMDYRASVVRRNGHEAKPADLDAPCPTCHARLRHLTRREIGQRVIQDGMRVRPLTDAELAEHITFGVLHNHVIHDSRDVPMIGYSDRPQESES